MNKSQKILLISSSTGGHAIPVRQLYDVLNKTSGFKIKIIHSGSKIERELFKDLDSTVVASGKINRFQKSKNILELIKILWAVFQALYILALFRPQVVFSKGGFNSFPVLFWVRLFRIPYFLHETDSEMGLANRIFFKQSQKTFVSFPPEMYGVDEQKLFYSGMIVRDFDTSSVVKNEKPMLFIIGGSQGSEAINKIIFDSLPRLLDDYIVIHSIGISDERMVRAAMESLTEEEKARYHYFPFSMAKIDEYLPKADLVISRAGGTIGEIAKLSKASILIPYPYAANDHQMKNAKYLEKVGGAILVKQEILDSKILIDRINFIMSDPKNWKVIGENAHRMIKTDGKEVILRELKKYLGVK